MVLGRAGIPAEEPPGPLLATAHQPRQLSSVQGFPSQPPPPSCTWRQLRRAAAASSCEEVSPSGPGQVSSPSCDRSQHTCLDPLA